MSNALDTQAEEVLAAFKSAVSADVTKLRTLVRTHAFVAATVLIVFIVNALLFSPVLKFAALAYVAVALIQGTFAWLHLSGSSYVLHVWRLVQQSEAATSLDQRLDLVHTAATYGSKAFDWIKYKTHADDIIKLKEKLENLHV